MRVTQSDAKRVLIYRLGSLGDMLIALPSLHLVAKCFPNAERRMLTNFPVAAKAPAAAAILENTGLVAGYERYLVGERNPLRLLALIWRIRRWKPEVLVYLAAARGTKAAKRDAMFFRLCRIREQVGVPLTDVMQHNAEDAEGIFEPEAERLARCIGELGDAELHEAASWDLHLTDQENEKFAEALKPMQDFPVLAVSIGTKVQSKDWRRDNWRAADEGRYGVSEACAGAVWLRR